MAFFQANVSQNRRRLEPCPTAWGAYGAPHADTLAAVKRTASRK